MAAEGGWTLNDHVHSTQTLDALQSSRWDFVVLQEQSEVPASEQNRTEIMYPAVRQLVERAKLVGATPILFVTWAHQGGLPQDGLPSYGSMQLQIDQGYQGIAAELGVPLAPVGEAWSVVALQDPALGLWETDGSHPSELGTYLAACVFYAVVFRESPAGLSYRDHLPGDQAQLVQAAAADTVLDTPKQWNLP